MEAIPLTCDQRLRLQPLTGDQQGPVCLTKLEVCGGVIMLVPDVRKMRADPRKLLLDAPFDQNAEDFAPSLSSRGD